MECSTDESDTDTDGHIIDTRPKGRQNDSRIAGPVGISRSAQDAAQINVSLQNGSFNINKKKLDRFLKKLAALDRAAEVREFGKRRRWQVWHSRCAKWKYMKGPYSTTRFREHVTKCNARQFGVGKKMPRTTTHSLLTWFKKVDGKPSRGSASLGSDRKSVV